VNKNEIQLKVALKIKLIRIELKVILEELFYYYYIRNFLKLGSCK